MIFAPPSFWSSAAGSWRFVINVDVGAELGGEVGLVLSAAAADGDGAVAGLGGELDGKVAEAADSDDGDGVAGAGSAVAQGVEGGDSGAHERAGVDGRESVGHEGEGVGGGDDVVGVASVVGDSGDLAVLTEDEIAAAAGFAIVAVAAMPAEADALADFEDGDVGANGVDDAGDLVAGNAGIGEAGKEAVLGEPSLWQTPQACTRMRTWPGPGSGNSFWTNSKSALADVTWVARPLTDGMVFSWLV